MGECPSQTDILRAASRSGTIDQQFTTPRDGIASLTGWMTALVSDATMPLVEDDEAPGVQVFRYGEIRLRGNHERIHT